ncbi:hypothetical protein EIN_052070 [Entamoeba invadens IP1]|uniref:hypothetical protein n=1 Tax=Entamoeba invadens IP1 TaxID=370355 RepID=UPI0002C3DF05|nr:hypothetical protein EIN_052070 [Entamoeba invadens IP1]ELP93012.1 hypothetical protein EIN_052070 [Entamoeba invadens IP1]|eukprot:XP_004259783.1 hypothetical protein EIN_052070 [Entamoeba invadens IP1]
MNDKDKVTYYPVDHQIEKYPVSNISGFCNNGDEYYTVDKDSIQVYSKDSRVQINQFTIQGDIMAIKAVDNPLKSCLIVVQKDAFVLVNLPNGEMETYICEGIDQVFTDIFIPQNQEFFYFVVSTKPFSLKLMRISIFPKSSTFIENKLNVFEMESHNDLVSSTDISYPTFTNKPAFVDAHSRPYIEVSDSGRKPYPNVFYLDDFVPTVVVLKFAKDQLFVTVGGNDSVFFGYQVYNPILMFSMKIPSERHGAVQKIFFDFESQVKFVNVVVYGNDTTEIFFFSMNDSYEIGYVNLQIFDKFRLLAANSHVTIKETLTSLLLFDKTNAEVRQYVFDSHGEIISDSNTLIKMTLPINCIDQKEGTKESEMYLRYIGDVGGVITPNYVNIVSAGEWINVMATSYQFERFVQCVKLLPVLILGKANDQIVLFYKEACQFGFNLPRMNDQQLFVSTALEMLIDTNNIDLFVNEFENTTDVESIISETIYDYFTNYHKTLTEFFESDIMKNKLVNQTMLEEIEEKLAVVKTVMMRLNAESDVLEMLDNNLYCVRYFTPLTEYLPALLEKEVIQCDGSLITPMIDLVMPGHSYPVSIELVMVHLFSHKIYPPLELYLHYLFIVHGLENYRNKIPGFSDLPEIAEIAYLLVAFDSGNYNFFFEKTGKNTNIRMALVTDIIPVMYKYYTTHLFNAPSKYTDYFINFADDTETLKLDLKYLVVRNKCKQAIGTAAEFLSRFNATQQEIRENMQYAFDVAVEEAKIAEMMQVVYNTTLEHQFMTTCLKSRKEVILELLMFFININDIFSATLLFVHINTTLFKEQEDLKTLHEIFQEFVDRLQFNDTQRIKVLALDKQQLDVFINSEKDVDLGEIISSKY